MSKRRRKWLRWGAIVLGVALLGAIALGIWIYSLDRIVTAQFEGRRWTLPAQVYAQPIDLYAGQALSADGLEQELRRLGYEKVDSLKRAGSYRRRANKIDFISRRFQFSDEAREESTVSVNASGSSISSVNEGGAEAAIFRLDPLLIGSIFPIHGEDRVVVTPQEVPQLLPAALKVVEDRKFDTHHGVDLMGIVRAAWVDVRTGRFEQGGSTLTQQLIRSYFLDNRQTLGRKVQEALMAIILEARFSKADVMNSYINEIYLGQDGNRAIHGFGLASQFYFGKPLSELELNEIATLVAIARGPSYYDPRTKPQRVLERRDLVLSLLMQFGMVPQRAAEDAKKKPLGIVGQGRTRSGYYPAFLDFVRRTLRRDYREADLTEAGLRIFTTLDPFTQSRAEEALKGELERLDKNTKRKDKALEGVVIVTAPQSGDVTAMVGGRRVGFDGFNRALDARRSIGSLVKPVVYLAALETGRYNATSIIQDAPIEVKLADGQTWKPQNIYKDFNGPVPMVRALAQSLNLATVNLGLDVGLAKVADEFQKLGLEQPPPQHPSLLLGSIDLAPVDVAQLYNSLANGGFRTPLRAVRAIVDAQGKPLKAFPIEVTPVSDPATVYQLDRMMVQVMERGTGRGARSALPANVVFAGKTGTSSDYRDSWFAGFAGSQLAVVWIGYDDNKPTGLTGAGGALNVWAKVMNGVRPTSWDTPLPDELHELTIDYASGLQATTQCSAEILIVAVPQGADVPFKADCSSPTPIRSWLRGIIGK